MVDPELLYIRILEYMQGGVLALDRKGNVRAFNPAAEHMLGMKPETVTEHPFAATLFDDPANDEFAQALLDAVYDSDSRHNRDIEYQRGDQHIWLNLITSALWSQPSPGEERQKVGVVALFVDITERKIAEAALRCANEELEQRVGERTRQLAEANLNLQREIAERVRAEEQLAYLAAHDALTGLPNRRDFERRLVTAVGQGGEFALVYLDLDGFKAINDTHGHDMGDRLLQDVSRRLESCIGAGDGLARLGGDEFAVILKSPRTEQEMRAVVEGIVAQIGAPYCPGGEAELRIGVSFGVARFPRDGDTPRELIQASDRVMYAVKRSGRGPWPLAAPDADDT